MRGRIWCVILALCLTGGARAATQLRLSPHDTFETHGLSVIVDQSRFHPVFRDEKNAGIQIILHGERIATDGAVRLQPTPEQWDPVPELVGRKRGARPNQLIVTSQYADEGFKYRVEVTAESQGFRVAVQLDEPLPKALEGKAGFNLDFLPTDYFDKSYMMGGVTGIFPRYPGGPMRREADGKAEPLPLAAGNSIVLSPEDPLTRVSIVSDTPLALYDARDRAQNGWFVVRALIPAGRTGNVLVWHVRPHVVPGWRRAPVVSYNQVGYTPARSKVAIIELDPLYRAPKLARVLRIGADGRSTEAFRGAVRPWGKWLRYAYATFDFSALRTPGVYAITYAGHTSEPFRIAADVYQKGVWQPSLDTYLAEQMDHVKVRENYRVWHGVSHMDDARQAPPGHVHFDGYAQGPTTDSPFQAGEHIPGLNVGGWFDAGDFDIRTESQAQVERSLVMAREQFGIDWDDTTVDEAARSVEIRRPDGVPDIIEQIKHGVLQLMAQYDVFGHAIPGIIAPTLQEYTHLGDAGSKTDGKIYDPKMGPLESNGDYSGVPDDRWAFTIHVTALDYDAASALAAASRVLRGTDDALAEKCLQTAIHVWEVEHKGPPATFHSFNTTGRDLPDEEVMAAVELVLATKGGALYVARLKELLPVIREHFLFTGYLAVRALPYMDADFRAALETEVKTYKAMVDKEMAKNPFHVPIGMGTWGGAQFAAGFAAQMYLLHEAFPTIVGTEYTLDGFDYVLGRHPASNVSLVSAVGTESKLVAYGNNRADYSFIAGGMIPGVLVIKPDFPELKHGWPFLWYENEYVIDAAATFILAANAAEAVMKE